MTSPWLTPAFAKESLARIDQRFLPDTEQQVAWLLRRMELRLGDSLLDLGCGAGRHSIALARQGLRVTGIDISETMLEQAKARAAASEVNIQFRQADLVHLGLLELGAGRFQAAICLCESGIGMLGNTGHDHIFFREVFDLLAPGGWLSLSCFNALRRYIHSKDQNPRFDYINGVLHWSCEMDGVKLREAQRQYTPSEMKLLLSLSGFEEIQVLSCAEGCFSDAAMGIEDIEMLVLARRPF